MRAAGLGQWRDRGRHVRANSGSMPTIASAAAQPQAAASSQGCRLARAARDQGAQPRRAQSQPVAQAQPGEREQAEQQRCLQGLQQHDQRQRQRQFRQRSRHHRLQVRKQRRGRQPAGQAEQTRQAQILAHRRQLRLRLRGCVHSCGSPLVVSPGPAPGARTCAARRAAGTRSARSPSAGRRPPSAGWRPAPAALMRSG